MKNILTILIAFFLISCNDSATIPIEKTDLGTGVITTIADGFDVKTVKLWSSTNSDRVENCALTKDIKVKVLEEVDEYYLVQDIKDNGCKGYCMKGFIVLDK